MTHCPDMTLLSSLIGKKKKKNPTIHLIEISIRVVLNIFYIILLLVM